MHANKIKIIEKKLIKFFTALFNQNNSDPSISNPAVETTRIIMKLHSFKGTSLEYRLAMIADEDNLKKSLYNVVEEEMNRMASIIVKKGDEDNQDSHESILYLHLYVVFQTFFTMRGYNYYLEAQKSLQRSY